MSPLAAARQLSETEPTYEYSYFGSDRHDCCYCDGGPDSRQGHVFVHESDCPVLALPGIVAALEAAVLLLSREPERLRATDPEWVAFKAALKGEVVPSSEVKPTT